MVDFMLPGRTWCAVAGLDVVGLPGNLAFDILEFAAEFTTRERLGETTGTGTSIDCERIEATFALNQLVHRCPMFLTPSLDCLGMDQIDHRITLNMLLTSFRYFAKDDSTVPVAGL